MKRQYYKKRKISLYQRFKDWLYSGKLWIIQNPEFTKKSPKTWRDEFNLRP